MKQSEYKMKVGGEPAFSQDEIICWWCEKIIVGQSLLAPDAESRIHKDCKIPCQKWIEQEVEKDGS